MYGCYRKSLKIDFSPVFLSASFFCLLLIFFLFIFLQNQVDVFSYGNDLAQAIANRVYVWKNLHFFIVLHRSEKYEYFSGKNSNNNKNGRKHIQSNWNWFLVLKIVGCFFFVVQITWFEPWTDCNLVIFAFNHIRI